MPFSGLPLVTSLIMAPYPTSVESYRQSLGTKTGRIRFFPGMRPWIGELSDPRWSVLNIWTYEPQVVTRRRDHEFVKEEGWEESAGVG